MFQVRIQETSIISLFLLTYFGAATITILTIQKKAECFDKWICIISCRNVLYKEIKTLSKQNSREKLTGKNIEITFTIIFVYFLINFAIEIICIHMEIQQE